MDFCQFYWRMRQHDWNLRPFDTAGFDGCYRRRCERLFFRKSFQQRRIMGLAIVLAISAAFFETKTASTTILGVVLGLSACLVVNFAIEDVLVKIPAFRHAKERFARLRLQRTRRPYRAQAPNP